MFGGSMIASYAVAALAAACLAGAGAWQVQAWRYDARLAAIEADHATNVARVVSAYREKETALLAAKTEAEVQYAKQRKAAARSADGARIALDSLRATLKAPAGGASKTAATGPGTDGASAAREVVRDCAGTLVQVAADADRLTAQLAGLQGYVSGVCRP